jgi:hypothetical protein
MCMQCFWLSQDAAAVHRLCRSVQERDALQAQLHEVTARADAAAAVAAASAEVSGGGAADEELARLQEALQVQLQAMNHSMMLHSTACRLLVAGLDDMLHLFQLLLHVWLLLAIERIGACACRMLSRAATAPKPRCWPRCKGRQTGRTARVRHRSAALAAPQPRKQAPLRPRSPAVAVRYAFCAVKSILNRLLASRRLQAECTVSLNCFAL